METIILLLASFLLGSVPFGLIVGKLWGSVDVRRYGSGNIGASNVMRTVGKAAGAVVLILDGLKGATPVLAARSLDFPEWIVALAGLSAVAGHIWSVFLNFNGGKGIATPLGVVLAVTPLLGISLFLVWLLVLLLTRYISVASLAGAVCLPIFAWTFGHWPEHVICGTAISLLAFLRHRSNLQRLRAGTEYRFGQRAGVKADRQ